MECLSTENNEIDFDDNGLQNAILLTSRQEIVFSDCSSDNPRDDSQLNSCDSFPTGSGEDKCTEFDLDESKFYREVPFDKKRGKISFGVLHRTVSVIYDKESKQPVPNDEKESNRSIDQDATLNLSVGNIIKKEGAENVDRKSAIGWVQVEAKDGKFRVGRFPKYADCSKSSTDLKILSSLAYILATSFATISWQLSISLTVGIIILMPSVGVEGALTSVPVNTLAVVGNTARINCSTDLSQPVYWARTVAGSDVQQWLYYGKNGFNGNNADNRFSMDKDETTGRYDVIIANVQPKDAGQYVCVDESGIGAKASAELVVSDPISCNSRIPSDGVMGYNVFGIEQDFIEISCSLTYTGNLAVTLEWSWPRLELQSDERAVSSATSPVTSTFKLSPTKEHNNVKFQCKANIEGAKQRGNDSGLLWESDTVNVRYAEFASKAVEACPGVEWNLICNPQCSYYSEKKDNDCQCQYTYYDERTQRKYEVASDAISCGKDNNIRLAILIAVAIVATFSVAIAIILACRLQKKKIKRGPLADSGESG